MKLNWNQFRSKHSDARTAFETLCYHLFCREHKIANGIRADINQAGLETLPALVENVNYGFQSKFFDHTVDYSQIRSSVETAIAVHAGSLDHISIYMNLPMSEFATIPAEIAVLALEAGVTIDWIVPSIFDVLLFKPSNLDLLQYYFGLGNEIQFLLKNTDQATHTLLSSREYLSLPISLNGTTITDLKASILGKSEKVSLLAGSPGAGKSISIQKLFYDLAELDKKNHQKMIEALVTSGAIPLIVNLKNCHQTSLESILYSRKDENKIDSQTLNFIYLFDGLDELSEDLAESTLSYIHELSKKGNTKKIILSCRSSNFNRSHARSYFEDLNEYIIGDLDNQLIEDFFKNKMHDQRTSKLISLRTSNPTLISSVKDILFVKLLWETIEELNDSSSVLDLLEKKTHHLLKSSIHKKSLNQLNLPNPKENEINTLNQEISQRFQKAFQFRFPLKDLVNLVLERYDRIDYRSANEIVNYIADIFFDHSGSDDGAPTFIYRHRRFQEYFLTQKIALDYQTHPKVLREHGTLANLDVVQNLFTKYLKKMSIKNFDISGILEANLIDAYLGKHQGFAVNDAFFLDSSRFITALASQNDTIFNEILGSDQFNLPSRILIDLEELRKSLEIWKVNRRDYYATDFIRSIWQNAIATNFTNIRTLHESGKIEFANLILENALKAIQLIEESGFTGDEDEQRHLEDPHWKVIDDWTYITVLMKNKTLEAVLNVLVRKNYDQDNNEPATPKPTSNNVKLISALIRVGLKYQLVNFKSLLPSLNEFETEQVVLILSETTDFLNLAILDSDIKDMILPFLESYTPHKTQKDIPIFFLKKFFNLEITEENISFLEQMHDSLRDTRKMDWEYEKLYFKFAQVCFILNRHSFADLNKKSSHEIRYFIDHILYSALYGSLIKLLCKTTTIEQELTEYKTYCNTKTDHLLVQLKQPTSDLLGHLVSVGVNDLTSIQLVRNIIFDNKSTLLLRPSILYRLHQSNHATYMKIVNRDDLIEIENSLKDWNDDFPSFIDRCFDLSIFFSAIRPNTAKIYFEKAIIEGLLRHGWRKDSIVSYDLVNSLGLLWRNNFLERKQLRHLTEKVLGLTVRVANITDGKGTWQGPFNVLELAAEFDLRLAEHLKKKLETRYAYPRSNKTTTIILLAQVSVGISLDKIEEGMRSYRHDYRHDGKLNSEHFEEQFRVYIAISNSNIYSEDVRKAAFTKAFNIVDEVISKNIEYAFTDRIDAEKLIYQQLCEKYSQDFKLTVQTRDNGKVSKLEEPAFVSKFTNAKTKEEIQNLFDELYQYENHIVLKEQSSWRTIVETTLSITESLDAFFNFLKRYRFPQSDFHSNNSKYLHYALGAALADPETKLQAFEYLKDNSGHGGFWNVMNSYAANGDRETCVHLFDRYLKFCELLVN